MLIGIVVQFVVISTVMLKSLSGSYEVAGFLKLHLKYFARDLRDLSLL